MKASGELYNGNMTKEPKSDLEKRTAKFAKDVRALVKKIPKTIENVEDGRQLIRSSGSVVANYIEANECVGDDDFIYRNRLCKKEAKESRLWLSLLDFYSKDELEKTRKHLMQEAKELTLIFASIVRNKTK